MISNASLIKRFELAVMRPIWLSVIAVGFVHGLRHEWWSVGAMVLALFAFGGVGVALHPMMSAAELAEGTTGSAGAEYENGVLSSVVQRAVIARGCTLVATFLVPYLAWITICVFGWKWQLALPISFAAATFIGGAIRYLFVLRAEEPTG